MGKKTKILAALFIIVLLCGCSGNEGNQSTESTMDVSGNPIDAYFIPRINSSSAEVERRELQDTYRGVWEAEYENVIVWITSKCQYQDDIDKLMKYVASVDEMIAAARNVMLSEWLDVYDMHPDDPDRNSWGNGTRSGLNQVTGEIYRNAAILLIEHCEGYEYREIDYSKEHYE